MAATGRRRPPHNAGARYAAARCSGYRGARASSSPTKAGSLAGKLPTKAQGPDGAVNSLSPARATRPARDQRTASRRFSWPQSTFFFGGHCRLSECVKPGRHHHEPAFSLPLIRVHRSPKDFAHARMTLRPVGLLALSIFPEWKPEKISSGALCPRDCKFVACREFGVANRRLEVLWKASCSTIVSFAIVLRGTSRSTCGGGDHVPKVLIAEDDKLIADMIEYFLTKQGYEVCGITGSVEAAVELGRIHHPDLAILDLRLANGGLGTAIAASLTNSNLGILYATANGSDLVSCAAIGHACLAKPYGAADLLHSAEIVVGIIAGRTAKPPFPRGFVLLNQAIVPQGSIA